MEALEDPHMDFSAMMAERECNHQELGEMLGLRMPERIISVRHIWDYWPVSDYARINEAFSRYGAGLSEIAQGRTRFLFILYEFKRKEIRIVRKFPSIDRRKDRT